MHNNKVEQQLAEKIRINRIQKNKETEDRKLLDEQKPPTSKAGTGKKQAINLTYSPSAIKSRVSPLSHKAITALNGIDSSIIVEGALFLTDVERATKFDEIRELKVAQIIAITDPVIKGLDHQIALVKREHTEEKPGKLMDAYVEHFISTGKSIAELTRQAAGQAEAAALLAFASESGMYMSDRIEERLINRAFPSHAVKLEALEYERKAVLANKASAYDQLGLKLEYKPVEPDYKPTEYIMENKDPQAHIAV